jgi:hypothetical protein
MATTRRSASTRREMGLVSIDFDLDGFAASPVWSHR